MRTGQPLRVHDQMTDEEWGVYQRGMRSGIEMLAQWVARRLPMPRAATEMLDIGGSHGYWSVALCRRHPRLRSTVLDLPQAIRHAAPLLAREGMGDRVVHRAGDALTDDLGSDAYDLVFLAAVVHHFDEETNRELMRRIARALRPGGIVAVWEPLRQDTADNVRQIGGLLDLFFGFFSQAGTWSSEEIADWQRGAGLVPLTADPHVDGARPGAARGSEAGVNRSAAAEDVLDLRRLSQHAAGNSGIFNARCAESRF